MGQTLVILNSPALQPKKMIYKAEWKLRSLLCCYTDTSAHLWLVTVRILIIYLAYCIHNMKYNSICMLPQEG